MAPTGRQVPVLALDVNEACESLGGSWKFFHEHVAHEVRVVRRGRRKMIAVTELQAWLDEHAELVFEPPDEDDEEQPGRPGRGSLPRPAAGSPAKRGVRGTRGTLDGGS